jgi:hypothetical protein
VEGNKQYILPALAAIVLVVLLVARNQAGAPEPTEATAPEPPAPATVKGSKAAIRDAVSAAGSPALDDTVRVAIHEGLSSVLERCRSSRPAAAGLTVTVSVDVLAAAGVGSLVERAEVEGDLPADLVGCVREGILSAKPGDLGKTGRFSGTLEYAAP